MKTILLAACAACIAVPAWGQDSWTSVTGRPVNGGFGVYVVCGEDGTPCPSNGPSDDYRADILLSDFATSGSVANLNERISAISAQERQAIKGVAVASSFNVTAPLDGSNNRIAIGTGTFQGNAGVSLNYTRKAGKFDLTLAAAAGNGVTATKAGVGFSF